jgi:hypothetical protein
LVLVRDATMFTILSTGRDHLTGTSRSPSWHEGRSVSVSAPMWMLPPTFARPRFPGRVWLTLHTTRCTAHESLPATAHVVPVLTWLPDWAEACVHATRLLFLSQNKTLPCLVQYCTHCWRVASLTLPACRLLYSYGVHPMRVRPSCERMQNVRGNSTASVS